MNDEPPEWASPFFDDLPKWAKRIVCDYPLLPTMNRDQALAIPRVGLKTVNTLAALFDYHASPHRLRERQIRETPSWDVDLIQPRNFEIYAKHMTGGKIKDLAIEYGISKGRTWQIIKGTQRKLDRAERRTTGSR